MVSRNVFPKRTECLDWLNTAVMMLIRLGISLRNFQPSIEVFFRNILTTPSLTSEASSQALSTISEVPLAIYKPSFTMEKSISHNLMTHQGLSLVKISALYHIWKLKFQGIKVCFYTSVNMFTGQKGSDFSDQLKIQPKIFLNNSFLK